MNCRSTVEQAIRRHRALAGKPFPQGECGQPQCVHALVRDVAAPPEHDDLRPLGERSCNCFGRLL